jgi:hypothetical protein
MSTANREQDQMDFIAFRHDEEAICRCRRTILPFALLTTLAFVLGLLAVDRSLAGVVLTFVTVPLFLQLLAAQ